MPVKFAPLIAGKAPVNFDAVRDDIRASATVPVKLPAGILVRFAAEDAGSVDGNLPSAIVPVKLLAGILVKFAPEPLNEVAVQTPEALIPLEKLTAALPSSPFISVTLISDMFIEYFYLFS